jgi:hypothetical protein
MWPIILHDHEYCLCGKGSGLRALCGRAWRELLAINAGYASG